MRAIITGAAMGIGKAIATAMAKQGAQLVLIDINEAALKDTAQELTQTNAQVELVCGSVADSSIAKLAVSKAVEAFGGLDCLSHNAGIQRYGSAESTEESLWDEVININLKSAFLMSKAALPELKKTSGSIIFMGSIQSLASAPLSAAYVTAKHGMVGLMQSIAVDFAANGVRANLVAPGSVDTPLLRDAVAATSNPEKVLQNINDMHPLGRFARAEEIANVVCFLASDNASFITGETIRVDGGAMSLIGGSSAS